MDFLRQIVAGPKNRFQQEGYNLDLTYITKRIIAMAFPASSPIQKLYRNSIDTISQFLQKHHNNNYIVINLSGRKIDENKLSNVHNFQWQDHQAPTLDTLFIGVGLIVNYLLQNSKRVVIVHCNHGKGRTGTMIICLLLFTQIFKTSQEAQKFYNSKRFEIGKKYIIDRPPQLLYMNYFTSILSREIQINQQVLCLKKVILQDKHPFTDLSIRIIKVIDKSIVLDTSYMGSNASSLSLKPYTLTINKFVYFVGDVKLQLLNESFFGKDKIATYTFNTALIPKDGLITIQLKELAPRQLKNQSTFGKKFNLKLEFQTKCKCTSKAEQSQECWKCHEKLDNEKQKWTKISSILKLRQKAIEQGLKLIYGQKISQQKQNANIS